MAPMREICWLAFWILLAGEACCAVHLVSHGYDHNFAALSHIFMGALVCLLGYLLPS